MREQIALPSIQDAEKLTSNDAIINVYLIELRTGEFFDFHLNDISAPIFWRPKISLQAEIFDPRKEKEIDRFHITQKASWKDFLYGAISPRYWFRLSPLADLGYMHYLLEQASHRLLAELLARGRRY